MTSSHSFEGFEWDEEKSRANLIKHGISFDDVSQIFYGTVVVKGSNRNDEERWVAIGEFKDRQCLSSKFDRDPQRRGCRSE